MDVVAKYVIAPIIVILLISIIPILMYLAVRLFRNCGRTWAKGALTGLVINSYKKRPGMAEILEKEKILGLGHYSLGKKALVWGPFVGGNTVQAIVVVYDDRMDIYIIKVENEVIQMPYSNIDTEKSKYGEREKAILLYFKGDDRKFYLVEKSGTETLLEFVQKHNIEKIKKL